MIAESVPTPRQELLENVEASENHRASPVAPADEAAHEPTDQQVDDPLDDCNNATELFNEVPPHPLKSETRIRLSSSDGKDTEHGRNDYE